MCSGAGGGLSAGWVLQLIALLAGGPRVCRVSAWKVRTNHSARTLCVLLVDIALTVLAGSGTSGRVGLFKESLQAQPIVSLE